MKSFKV